MSGLSKELGEENVIPILSRAPNERLHDDKWFDSVVESVNRSVADSIPSLCDEKSSLFRNC